MSEELKPCPFCGYEDPRRHRDGDRDVCPNCGALGPTDETAWGLSGDQVELPERLWDRRANQQFPAPEAAPVPSCEKCKWSQSAQFHVGDILAFSDTETMAVRAAH